MLRPAYAVEYDYLPAHQCDPSLQTKRIAGLFFSGQLNGTTGAGVDIGSCEVHLTAAPDMMPSPASSCRRIQLSACNHNLRQLQWAQHVRKHMLQLSQQQDPTTNAYLR